MAEDTRKLFVAGLPDSISEEVLKQLFEATGGNVTEVSLPKDRATGRPRGFGFVTLATTEEAGAARSALDGSYQGGKAISVRPFQAEPPRRDERGPLPGGPRMGGPMGGDRSSGPSSVGAGLQAAPDRTLYVGNLPYDATVEEVETLIGGTGAGPVVRVHLPTDPEGRKRGFGFVTMASADAAKGAIEALRGGDIRGRRLVVNLAHPKGERPAGGPPSSNYASPGGYNPGGGPPASSSFGAPPPAKTFNNDSPPRKPFDERRRRHDGDGGGGRRQKQWDPKTLKGDWDADD